MPIAVVGTLLGTLMLGIQFFLHATLIRLAAGLIAVALYFLAIWWFVLSDRERPVIARALSVFRQEPAS